MEYTTRGRGWFTTYKMVQGEAYNQIFTRGILRNDVGRILINALGLPVTTPGQTVPMGSANPDWTGGLSNSFRWKGFNLSALIDMRMGGEVFSVTEFYLKFYGLSEATLEGREGYIIDGVMESDGSENTIVVTAEDYWMSVGGRSTPVGEPGRIDASYVRLREILMGYIWNFETSVFQSIGLSLYGRNLGFLYNASWIIDPGMSIGVGNIQGMEGFSIPTSKTYGVNARFKF